jgi:hypothetical protein
VGLGCQFLNVGYENEDEYQSFGAFSVAIYDPQTRGNNHFLGCVDLSQFWQEKTGNDVGFTAMRISSAFMLGFATLATIICVCLQCFNKHGKSHLWNLMRLCYIGAAASQGIMFTVFASDMCYTEEGNDSNYDSLLTFNFGNKKCSPGKTGIVGVLNFVMLVGMVVATFLSLPPRNPVFQCWGGDIDWDEDSEGSTSEEDSVMRVRKAMSQDDSVSLFNGSRSMSKRSKNEDDAISAAEKGSLSSKMKKYLVPEEGSVRTAKSAKSTGSKKSKKLEKIPDESSVMTEKSSPSKKIKGVAKYLGMKKAPSEPDGVSVAGTSVEILKSGKTPKSTTGEEDQPGLDIPQLNSSASFLDTTMSSAGSGSTLEVTNFVLQLIEMTEVKEGGRRVKIEDKDNTVEIVDEYPNVANGEIQSNPGSDVAVVRTEFYTLGSRTIKEITHNDGSKTIVTTITVDNSSDSVTMASVVSEGKPQPMESIPLTHSAGSIASTQSSKYQPVMTTDTSVTSYKGGKNKQLMGMGDLTLSVGTMSVKSDATKSVKSKK